MEFFFYDPGVLALTLWPNGVHPERRCFARLEDMLFTCFLFDENDRYAANGFTI